MASGETITTATKVFSIRVEMNEVILVASLSRENDLVKQFVRC